MAQACAKGFLVTNVTKGAVLLGVLLVAALQGPVPARADCMSACQSDYYACTRAYGERDCATTRSICQMRCLTTNFGAIAYSDSTGAYGWAYNYDSRQGAERAAIGFCRDTEDEAQDCRVLAWFNGACGALAIDPDGPYGADWGRTRQDAATKALVVCRESGGEACEVEQVVCAK